MSLQDSVVALNEAVTSAKERIADVVSMYPAKCRTAYGTLDPSVKTFTVNGKGEIHLMRLSNLDDWIVKVDGETVYPSSSEPFKSSMMQAYGYYSYSSSLGRRSVQTGRFTYSDPSARTEPIYFNESFSMTLNTSYSLNYLVRYYLYN